MIRTFQIFPFAICKLYDRLYLQMIYKNYQGSQLWILKSPSEDTYFFSNTLRWHVLLQHSIKVLHRATSTYFWHIFYAVLGVNMCMYSYENLKSTPKERKMLVNIALGGTILYSHCIIVKKFVFLHITKDLWLTLISLAVATWSFHMNM